jgi:hypothetical protein
MRIDGTSGAIRIVNGNLTLNDYTFPAADGGAGEVLVTDGGGNLSFAAPGGVPDPLLLGFGSAGAPTYSFTGDSDTGIYRFNANTIGFTSGGTVKAIINPSEFVGVMANAPLMRLNASATATTPVFIPGSGATTGLGSAGAGIMSLIGGGVEIAQVDSTGLIITGADAHASNAAGPAFLNEAATDLNPTLVPNKTDPDTGMGWAFSGMFSLIGNGAELARGFAASLGGLHVNNTLTGAGLERVLTTADLSVANHAVQARRTTDFTITTAFSDVTLDTTDVETDAAVLDHDLVTNTDNIIVGVAGTYEITYGADIDPQASGANNIRCFGRVRVNDGGVDIPGSLASISSFADSSIDGDDVFARLQCSFIVTLSASDFVTLQISKVETDGSGTFTAEEVTLTVKRLL